jgi:hypothetical protein
VLLNEELLALVFQWFQDVFMLKTNEKKRWQLFF